MACSGYVAKRQAACSVLVASMIQHGVASLVRSALSVAYSDPLPLAEAASSVVAAGKAFPDFPRSWLVAAARFLEKNLEAPAVTMENSVYSAQEACLGPWKDCAMEASAGLE